MFTVLFEIPLFFFTTPLMRVCHIFCDTCMQACVTVTPVAVLGYTPLCPCFSIEAVFSVQRVGVTGLLTLSMCAYFTRLVGYTYIVNPWLILFLEPLHGVTYACLWTAGVSYMAEIAPKGLETTAQGILNRFVSPSDISLYLAHVYTQLAPNGCSACGHLQMCDTSAQAI